MQLASTLAAHSISVWTVGYELFLCYKSLAGNAGENSTAETTEEALEHAQLLKKENIRSDFSIKHSIDFVSNRVMGVNYPAISRASIYMWPGLKEADKNAYNFLLLRQFYYLKHSDPALPLLKVIGLSTAGFTLAYMTTSSPWIACATTTAIGHILHIVQYWKAADAADDFAIEHSSNTQLQGGMRYLSAILKIRMIYAKRHGLPGPLAEQFANGTFHFNCQTSIPVRLAKIQKEMTERRIKILKNYELDQSVNFLAQTIQGQLKGFEDRYLHLG